MEDNYYYIIKLFKNPPRAVAFTLHGFFFAHCERECKVRITFGSCPERNSDTKNEPKIKVTLRYTGSKEVKKKKTKNDAENQFSVQTSFRLVGWLNGYSWLYLITWYRSYPLKRT